MVPNPKYYLPITKHDKFLNRLITSQVSKPISFMNFDTICNLLSIIRYCPKFFFFLDFITAFLDNEARAEYNYPHGHFHVIKMIQCYFTYNLSFPPSSQPTPSPIYAPQVARRILPICCGRQ